VTYRELRRKAFAMAAAMVADAALDELYGDDLDERDEERATKAQQDCAEFIRRYAGNNS